MSNKNQHNIIFHLNVYIETDKDKKIDTENMYLSVENNKLYVCDVVSKEKIQVIEYETLDVEVINNE